MTPSLRFWQLCKKEHSPLDDFHLNWSLVMYTSLIKLNKAEYQRLQQCTFVFLVKNPFNSGWDFSWIQITCHFSSAGVNLGSGLGVAFSATCHHVNHLPQWLQK